MSHLSPSIFKIGADFNLVNSSCCLYFRVEQEFETCTRLLLMALWWCSLQRLSPPHGGVHTMTSHWWQKRKTSNWREKATSGRIFRFVTYPSSIKQPFHRWHIMKILAQLFQVCQLSVLIFPKLNNSCFVLFFCLRKFYIGFWLIVLINYPKEFEPDIWIFCATRF